MLVMKNIIKEAKYHLEIETGWSYQYHLWHSIKNSAILIKISIKSLVHGFLPFMWKSDAPRDIILLYHTIMKIQHIKKMDKLRGIKKSKRYE